MLERIWSRAVVHVSKLQNDIFQFCFNFNEDKQGILACAPSNIDNNLLILVEDFTSVIPSLEMFDLIDDWAFLGGYRGLWCLRVLHQRMFPWRQEAANDELECTIHLMLVSLLPLQGIFPHLIHNLDPL